jgi:amino acid transporter
MPKPFARLHPERKTPSVATFAAGIGAALFYAVMTFVSRRVLTDTILSLGIMICFYYGLTAFGCIWFFRHTLFDNAFNLVFRLLCPLLGGLGLFFVLIITLHDSASPGYGSGAGIGGIGLVLILGLGLILIGLVLMAYMRARHPAFFRGATLRHESAPAMRPHEHLVA